MKIKYAIWKTNCIGPRTSLLTCCLSCRHWCNHPRSFFYVQNVHFERPGCWSCVSDRVCPIFIVLHLGRYRLIFLIGDLDIQISCCQSMSSISIYQLLNLVYVPDPASRMSTLKWVGVWDLTPFSSLQGQRIGLCWSVRTLADRLY